MDQESLDNLSHYNRIDIFIDCSVFLAVFNHLHHVIAESDKSGFKSLPDLREHDLGIGQHLIGKVGEQFVLQQT